jgi:hypothetical protein
MKRKQTFPVTKNGKFFGYADADQIRLNKSLELYEPAPAIEKEEEKPEGIDPTQVRRRRGRPPASA